MILNGQLRGDDPLPTTRELSAQLGVSRNTAVLAYERLIAEGYIRTKPYVGTFVSPDLPDTAFLSSASSSAATTEPQFAAETVLPFEPVQELRTHRFADPDRRRLAADFWVGRPDARTFPLKAWSQHIKARLKTAGSKLTSYSDPAGSAGIASGDRQASWSGAWRRLRSRADHHRRRLPGRFQSRRQNAGHAGFDGRR